MRLGVFAKIFARPSLDETFDAIVAAGFSCIQFNMSCAGLPPLPDRIDDALVQRIREAADRSGLEIAAISGTFNMIDPDLSRRRDGLRRLDVLAASCRALGAGLITLCTGSRDPEDMWRRHPDNDSPEAWRDLVDSLRVAIDVADRRDVNLGVEPEFSNTIDSAVKARRLLDEMGSKRLKIVIDPANLFPSGSLARMRSIIDEAFDLLGDDVALAHAKDLDRDGAAGQTAAGRGLLDYDAYIRGLRRIDYQGPLILHGLSEPDVPFSRTYLLNHIDKH